MFRRIAYWGFLGGALWALAGSIAAVAEEKALTGVALVIGQSEYEHLAALPNPANDAEAIDDLLSDLGFEVDLVRDADRKKLVRALERFAEDAEGADVALIYYSGHGIEAGGENFLVPVDADIGALDDIAGELAPVSEMLARLESTVQVTIVLLDACRSNPFPAGSMVTLAGGTEPVPISVAGLGEPRGASALKPAGGDSPDGLGAVLGFAAAPGHVALDGQPGSNSPYAAALLKHLPAGGFAFSDVMTMVTEEVWLRTEAKQLPWTNSSLRRLLFFGGTVEAEDDETAPIRGERRKLLLSMVSVGDVERRQVAAAAEKNGVPMDALFGMLEALGAEAPDDPDQLARLLDEQAARVKSLLEDRAALKQSDPEIARLSGLAGEALAEGALEAALAYHERAKARVGELQETLDQTEADLKARRIEHAAVFASSAETYALAYDYVAAAVDFGKAFGQVERWDDRLALRYKQSQAKAFTDQHFFHADEAAGEEAITAYQEAIRLASPDGDPEGWADSRSGLALAIWGRGERQAETAEIERAVALLRETIAAPALAELPVKRAQLQGDLALVLMTLGERQTGTETLEQSVTASRAAMEVRTRAVAPLEWARLQNHLGSTLFVIGQRQQTRERLEEAVAAFRSALDVWTAQNAPMDWGNAQNNLALALGELGSRDPDAARLTEAAALLEAIFSVRTRAFAPLHWAETHSNLGSTLYHLGLREEGVARFDAAAQSFRLALEEITRTRDPLKWAGIEDNLGLALSTSAGRTGDLAVLDQAIIAFEAALSERTRERVPLEWAATSNNLANAYFRYGEYTHEVSHYRKAVPIYEAILSVRTRDFDAIGWASTNNNLANSYFSLGTHGDGPDSLRKAVDHYRLALSAYDRASNPVSYADTHYNLALVQLELGKQTSDRAVLAEGLASIEECRAVYHEAGQRQWDSYFDSIEAGIRAADLDLLLKEKMKAAE
ncbi:MAG: caspase family protein [Rhizobiaceae bacterium]